MDYDKIEKMALSCGFSHVGTLDASTIILHKEVRDACAKNTCKQYGLNWACPPGCGTLEEWADKIKSFQRGVILETTGELEDTMDYERMMELAQEHQEHFHVFADRIRETYPNALIFGDGICTRCTKCTYPDAPCRFPEKKTSAMEAAGMVVSEVCKDNDILYYYGANTLTYVGCVLVE